MSILTARSALRALLTAAFLFVPTAASAQRITAERIVSGLDQPVCLASAPGDSGRLFVLEQLTGKIRIIKNGSIHPVPFLDLGAKVRRGDSESGLLGMAFHPNYPADSRFFVYYTTPLLLNVLESYRVSALDPDVADPASVQAVLTLPTDQTEHHGGTLAFGPHDGYLYISVGDDRGYVISQQLSSLIGKILRIDVDSGTPYTVPSSNPFVGIFGALPEIWAYGLRNPWRMAFDSETGDLYIADVGANDREEIDFQPATSHGGENYGWPRLEGTYCRSQPCDTAGLIGPILEYAHRQFGDWYLHCVIGGQVYRGAAIPGLEGSYFFADISGAVWTYRASEQADEEVRLRTPELSTGYGSLPVQSICSFGQDASGELYFLDLYSGSLYRIAPDLMDLQSTPWVAGQATTVTISRAAAGATVFLYWSDGGRGLTRLPMLDVTLGIARAEFGSVVQADTQGTAHFHVRIPARLMGAHLWVQAAESGNTSELLDATVF